jgi:hypothetical protein
MFCDLDRAIDKRLVSDESPGFDPAGRGKHDFGPRIIDARS